jgi:hypothetical protein
MCCVRLRSDFHNFTKNGNASFRRCSEKSAFPFFAKFENHLARTKAAHFQTYTFCGRAVCENGRTNLEEPMITVYGTFPSYKTAIKKHIAPKFTYSTPFNSLAAH